MHGVYKPGGVKLRPELLGEIQAEVAAKYNTGAKPLDLVFHGGSGSTDEEIALAVANGVIKMNIDTDTQYAYTRAIADYMFKNYDGVLKVDGEVGNKKQYDPRAWGKIAESAMPPAWSSRPVSSARTDSPRADPRTRQQKGPGIPAGPLLRPRWAGVRRRRPAEVRGSSSARGGRRRQGHSSSAPRCRRRPRPW